MKVFNKFKEFIIIATCLFFYLLMILQLSTSYNKYSQIIQFYIDIQRNIMLRSFNKNKENRIIDIRKRFHFDPKSQSNKQRIAEVPKISEIIIRDENGQFSSVKEQQDFNDSSWLAKLVNGLQEQDGQSVKPLSQIGDLQSMNKRNQNISSKLFSNVYTIQRKGSEQITKYTERKSVPAIPNYKNKKKQKDGKKMSLQALSITNQEIEKQKSNRSKQIKNFKENDNKNSNRIINQKFIHNKQNKIRKRNQTIVQNDQQKENYKNSIINYSSIKQEEQQQMETKKLQQNNSEGSIHVMIDIDEVSLKTQITGQDTPLKNKKTKILKENKINTKQIKELDKNKSEKKVGKNEQKQVQRKKTKEKINDYQEKDARQQKKENYLNTPVCQFIQSVELSKNLDKDLFRCQKYMQKNTSENQGKIIPPVANIISQNQERDPKIQRQQFLREQNHQIEQVSSYNQFLDTFKHQFGIADVKAVTRIGMIKKNNVARKSSQTFTAKQNIEKLPLEQIYNFGNQQIRIPTFSDRFPEQKLIKKQKFNQIEQLNKQNFIHSPLKNSSMCMNYNAVKPSPSTIKKGTDKTNKKSLQQIRQKHLGVRQKQSPKFNEKKVIQFSQEYKKSSIVNHRLKFEQVFKKLNTHRQAKIHKFNCFDCSLSEQQKYQFGSIISKIKYLNQSYDINQFIEQYLKLQGSHVEKQKQTFSNISPEHKPINLLSHLKAVDTNRQIKRNATEGENLYRGNSVCEIKSDKKNQSVAKILTQKKLDNIQSRYIRSDCAFQPLFPQTISTYTGYTQALSSSNLRQFDRIEMAVQNQQKAQVGSHKYSEGNDFGHIIDNLNSKLNNYIQHNNLEDTYRKFKLEFVQLRRNMHY